MPVTGVACGKSPLETFPCDAGLNVLVFADVGWVVVIDEPIVVHLPINDEGGECESQVNQINPIFVLRFIHLFKMVPRRLLRAWERGGTTSI